MSEKNVHILGGGIAGLAVGYYLKKEHIPFTVFEALGDPGGNCRTIEINDFLFDTGAHRIHDKDPEITGQIRDLMGSRLKRVSSPSKIFENGRLLSFPLEMRDVFSRMDRRFTIRAGIDLLKSRWRSNRENHDFENFAVYSYGRAMADRFLLNYSKKLWGVPCSTLSTEVSGERLKSINVRTLLKNFISKEYAQHAHYEGDFYYPENGIGQLARAYSEVIGERHMRLSSRVTGVFHDNERITGIEVNGAEHASADHYVSTLPITSLVGMMRPAPGQSILDIVKSMKFRNIRLAVFFVGKKAINNAATMYFPADKYVFTRGYEPKNRCPSMSPDGRTSFVVEVPCFDHDWAWNAHSSEFIDKVKGQFIQTGLVSKEDILGCSDERIAYAYPVLEKGYREKALNIFAYLSRFNNLEISGRCGLFQYLWIHDLLREGKNIAGRIARQM